MSWFTADAKGTPVCMRCKTGQFSVLVKRSGDFDIYDCRKCGPVPQREEKRS